MISSGNRFDPGRSAGHADCPSKRRKVSFSRSAGQHPIIAPKVPSGPATTRSRLLEPLSQNQVAQPLGCTSVLEVCSGRSQKAVLSFPEQFQDALTRRSQVVVSMKGVFRCQQTVVFASLCASSSTAALEHVAAAHSAEPAPPPSTQLAFSCCPLPASFSHWLELHPFDQARKGCRVCVEHLSRNHHS